MIKKVGVFLFIFLVLGIVEVYLEMQNEVGERVETSIEVKQPAEVESLVQLIFEDAKKGKVLDIPFIVGETDMEQIHELWGNPDRKSENSKNFYDTYFSKNASIGHRSGAVFDIRSNSMPIQQIRLEDIKEIGGEPDEMRVYQDEEVNQTILLYEVTPIYQLKWILPKPTENEPNPAVDHVSIYTKLEVARKEENQIITEMSLEEKIGQMIFAGITGTSLSKETKKLVSSDKVGGLIFFKDNLQDVNQAVTLINSIKAESSDNKIPLLLGVDQEGGRVSRLPKLTSLPTNREIGEQNNEALSYRIGNLLGQELNAFGLNINFAPVLDVNSNSNNPVIGDRSFGNNAGIVSKLGIQTMQGIQSQNVISVVKHFPGHGDTGVDSHLELPVIQKSIEDLNALELIPFKNAIADSADVVMIAHILLPKIDPNFPSSLSHEIISGILREQLQFDGVVMTDDMTMNAIIENYEIGQATVEAVKAGNDIVLIAHEYTNVKRAIESILQAVKSGEITEERINTSVERILSLKEKYKVSNDQVKEVDIEQINQSIEQTVGS
ncbi:beta-N-acetylhexosaminidase [Psychrobacillus sp. FSL H8-0483]|uniref:beta-N-acetylhexosaminidase n=1 Tax=Psychrobacillus sp. FSL H8-0483 TaxID=2921389 RepID=UPI00315ACACC